MLSKAVQEGKTYNLYSWSAQGKINPINIVKAEGIHFWDEGGKKYYDMSSQLVNLNLGFGDKRLINAIKEQAEKMAFIGPGYSLDVRTEAAKKIVERSGLKGAKVFFTNAGAEANENAIKMAKSFTGKWKVFSMYRSYHGATYGAANLTGEQRRFINEPGIPGFIKYDGPYPYRAPKALWNKLKDEEEVTAFYLELLENQILYEGPQNIAAIFGETVVGTNGVLVPPKGYLKGVRELCNKYDICMVCDEVMAGFGRTGKWFAYQHWDVEPDLVTFAKGSTCGYIPLGGVIVSKKISDYFDDHKMYCGLTYSAHPMGCAVAIATIDAYEEDKTFDNVNKMGKVLSENLERMKELHPCVGDVRYIGLLSIVELVKDKESREPLVPYGQDPDGIMGRLGTMLKTAGFSTAIHENMFHVSPPLIINEEQLNEAFEILDKVLIDIDKYVLDKN